MGTQRPDGPVHFFPRSHMPMVVGHCTVMHLPMIWVPFLQSAVSTCPAVLPQTLSPATHLPTFFSRQHGHMPEMSQGHNSTTSAVLVEGLCTSSEPQPPSGTPPTIQPLLPAGVSPPQGTSPSFAGQFSPFCPPSMITPMNTGKLESELLGHVSRLLSSRLCPHRSPLWLLFALKPTRSVPPIGISEHVFSLAPA